MDLMYVFTLLGFFIAEYALYKASRATGIKTILTDHLIIGGGGAVIGAFIGLVVIETILFFI